MSNDNEAAAQNRDGKADCYGPGADAPSYLTRATSTRFRKGVSGNPSGRPRGSQNVHTITAKVIREKVTIHEHGRRYSISKLEACVKQLFNKAASGDIRAIRDALLLALQAQTHHASLETKSPELNESDRDVMAGIVKRLLLASSDDTEPSDGGQS